MTSIEDVLARLDKETLKKFRMGSDIKRDLIPTSSIGLNMLLGGGISKGHQTTFWGGESSGKTALMLQTIGLNQKAGLSAAFIDAENTFDPVWAERLGVDTKNLPVYHTASIGGTTDEIIKLVNAGVDIIVVDSISTLMPKSFYEKSGEIKAFENTAQIGQQARELGSMCRMIQGENFGTAIVFISQVRMDLGGFMPGQKASGGKEVGHLDSLRVKLTSSKSDKQAIKGEVQRGGMIMEETIGRNVKWEISKNKINGRYGVGEYDLITQGENVGLDDAAELLDYALLYGVAEKGGAWFTVNGERFQGKTKAVSFIRDNPPIREFLAAEVESKLTISSTPEEAEDVE